MSKEKVLVIYEIIPEEAKVAVVEMTVGERNFFFQGAGYFENAGDFDEVKSEVGAVISNALCSREESFKYCETDMQKEYFGKWKDYLVKDTTTSLDQPVNYILHCGFYL